ncbi:hypothetical protein EXIGLDRAFT_725333 [Exidia glandulosa HHB12029]|uniref:SGNH hydrolase n=1 Tax=Exidia glandulosa HHB12029 TaxID=1314781 RepID=A0A165MJX6_EXIGL|nr:hypothetical protein EXIGLDRAFT_725333 [Exidia glandulosa HHB12029]
MISFSILLATFFLSVVSTTALPRFDHVVIFGDSYSDVDNPVITTSAAWPTYLSSYTGLGANVKSYAKQAKQCIHIQTEQLPEFIRDSSTHPPDSTLYIVFIGFNDLAALGGDSLVALQWDDRLNVSSCPVQVMSNLTATAGAKHFLWFKMVPFKIVPLFTPPNGSFKDIGPQVAQLGKLGNSLTTALLEDFAAADADLSVGIFDTYSLFNDIHDHPSSYLNGSLPPDVNSYVTRNKSRPADVRDSFMWWDQNHPSEQINRIIARRVAEGLGGNTEWVSWLPSKPPTSQSYALSLNKKTIVALGFAIGVLYSW